TTATHNGNSRNFWYFATPITEQNFVLQPDGSNQGDDWKDEWNDAELGIKPIDVYVERLAAKVEVVFPTMTYTLSSDGYYETFIKTHDKTNPVDSIFSINGMDDCKIKIRIYGWGLNGQAKSVKYMKTVNEGQTPFITSDGWDFNGTNRCYWAKTPKYNSGDYPNDFNSVKNKTGIGGVGNYTDDLANSESLKYISWNTVKNNKFKDKNTAYVMPHTEAGEQINLAGEVRHSAVTEVLLAAQIMVTDADGNVLKDNDGKEKGLELFEISGTLYTLEGVKNYVLHSAGSHLWKEKDVKYFDAEGNELSEYVEGCKKVIYSVETIKAEDINIIYDYDGAFKFQLTEEAYNTPWYRSYEEVKDDNGNLVTIEMKQQYLTQMSVQDEVNSYLPAKQTWAYKDGMMYYNIPIRHLRPLPADNASDKSILSGMYGVVRNHWYQVTIGNVTNLGHAVYRPSEHIIPPSDATRYMIGSKINILSWRMVSQTAEL
ncbi:MAG: Mfa1 fimbrilin C-terminal domain-containing protein, partial [Muribaculaceae bacterium]|nr:Mfa1 fimbrilin C-terminal domain-containing protein [Muribaculaceae bacterium]